MKNFFQQENQDNNQKKTRKHYGKDYSKRPWKTPSPNLNVDFKSPRFIRNGQKQGKQKNRDKDKQRNTIKNQQHQDQYGPPSKINIKTKFNTLHHHHNHEHKIDQLKTKNFTDSDQRIHRYNQKNNMKKSATEEQLQQYSHYFQKNGHTKDIITQNSQTKFQLRSTQNNIHSDNQKSKNYSKLKNSMLMQPSKKLISVGKPDNKSGSADDYDNSYGTNNQGALSANQSPSTQNIAFSSTKKFQQTIRRYNKENTKLRKIAEQYSHQISLLKSEKDGLQKQCQKFKVQVTELGLKIYELKQQIYRYQVEVDRQKKAHNYSSNQNSEDHKFRASDRQLLLQNQIKQLKYTLKQNQRELNGSNLEIYKMKQQICQLQIQKNKIESLLKKNTDLNIVLKDQQKNIQENERNRTSELGLEKVSPYLQHSDTQNRHTETSKQLLKLKQCVQCDKKQKDITQLMRIVQKKIFEIMKKDNMINSMMQQIKNLQNEIRLFQKPKNIYKKYSNIVNELNTQLIFKGLSELNQKYQDQLCQGDKLISKNRNISITSSHKNISKH